MNDTYFVTGISTEVGKTISSAIVVESLQADYWKPIQSGDLDNSDTMKVKSLISNSISTFFPSSYEFDYPASPHLSAQMEGRHIELAHIKRPHSSNTLVIEGAGGLFVPLNERNTILDLMLPTDKIVLVSRHYLGSINHTMLSVEALQRRGLNIFGIIFSGEENTATESWIASYTQIPIIGRIEEEPFFDKNTIKKYADLFKKNLK
ncbi:dethiobiotin synthase [uncultured Capnocytophaga sp.]|uniref:dethiobiotin synthase n=1 Tax=uncultured Capnocytophaga sp. TaxID=159273 RepID=UPI00288911F0|nr:dethiobiotin synthase [uncultured Capnocytophaga sp.]